MSGLATAIEELDLQPDGEAIALAIRLRDLLDAKINRAVGIYDARALYERDGAVSATGWLKQSCGMSEATELAIEALRVAESPDAEGEERSASRRRGDALTDIFRFFLDHQHDAPKNRNRPHVSLVLDWDRYRTDGRGGTYTDGVPASPATIRAALCDAAVSRVVTSGGSTILDLGTTQRLFSDTQFQALALRDQHCRHPGCDRPPQWCQAHHVIPWDDGGPTDLSNGVLKCSRHHHIGHRPGWTEKLEPDGTLHLTAPDGRTWTTTPPGVLARLPE